ncbi:hypothetical protein V502_07762 [Pseudogymnoascus sp. VKM F-4520 (FW-2644)]|nr:hypothetical protein V502_07762 [Pseudogymnoascus sp. VKM F-4520 (FW-2644)]
MHSNASSDASPSLAVQDFVFFASGSSKAATTIPNGPADVIAQVEGMKINWIRLFGADPNTRLAWAQPGEKASCVNRRARKYSLAVNGGHEGGNDPTSACQKCRLAKIPCIMAWKNSGLPIVLPLPGMFRKGVLSTDKAYWVMGWRWILVWLQKTYLYSLGMLSAFAITLLVAISLVFGRACTCPYLQSKTGSKMIG